MTPSLPDNPSLEFLRKQAKDLHKAHRNGDPTCCDILRNLRQFAGKPDADILAAGLSLSEAQFALAMDYGFKDWRELTSFLAAGDAEITDPQSGRVLPGLQFVRRATTHMGCLEGCVNYLGLDMSPGWLFGGTGHAFFMNVGDSFCPAGPHEWPFFSVVSALGQNLGIAFDLMMALPWEEGDNFATKQEQIWEDVCQAIDGGHPCYGWHYEFIIIAGYDERGYLLSGPIKAPRVHPDGYRSFHTWRDFGATAGPESVEIAAISQGRSHDDDTIVKDALTFATQAAQNGTGSGIKGYDAWIRGLEGSEDASGFGDKFWIAYHAAIWSECRAFAHAFLDEARQRLGGKIGPLLARAAEHYQVVGDSLAEVAELFPFVDGDEPLMRRNVENAKRRERAVASLKVTKAAEGAGLEALRQVLAAME